MMTDKQTKVNQQMQVERELRENEARFRSIVENSQSGIFIVDEKYEFIYINDMLCRILGRSHEEIIGLDFRSILDEESKQIVADRYARSQKGEDTPPRYEFNIVRKDGEKRRVDMSVSMIRDIEGRPRSVGQAIDITERKLAEQAIQESQKRFQGMVETINEWVWEVDTTGTYTYVSPRVKDLLGYEPEEVLGKTPFHLMPPEEAERLGSVFGELISQQAPLENLENVNQHKDGRLVILETSSVPIYDDDGNFIGYRGTDRDITEQAQMEQQIRKTLERRGEQLRLTTEIAQDIGAAPGLEEIYERVVTLVKERFGYYHTQIFRHDIEKNDMVVIEGYGTAGQKMLAAEHSLPYGKGVVGTAAATGEPVLASDVTTDPNWVPHPDMPNTKGELAVPIKWQNEVLGILDVQSDQAGALTEEDQVVLMGLAGQIASAIMSAQAKDILERQAAQLTILNRTGRNVASILDQDELLQRAVDALSNELGYFQAAVMLVDTEANDLYVAAATDNFWEIIPDGFRQPLNKGAIGKAAQIGETVLIDDAANNPLPYRIGKWLSPSSVSTPIKVGGRVIGILEVEAESTWAFDENDISVTETMADQIAIAIENARLLEQVQTRARREQTLREITARVRTFTDPDAIVRATVRELGTVLGRPTFARLGSAEELSQSPEDKNGQSTNDLSSQNGGE
ncbi:MAG: PAS domain S-box protein [Chloroflexota bacterium]|nr:PAS domain S-box protein [Chloroflexota bacterium]